VAGGKAHISLQSALAALTSECGLRLTNVGWELANVGWERQILTES
jgi:hypothetical protein